MSALNWSADGAQRQDQPDLGQLRRDADPQASDQHQLEGVARRAAADFDINYVRPPENLFLGPNGKAEIGTVFIPMRDIQAAIEERLHLYVWGRATYDDMFEGTKPHFFEFCHRAARSTGETPGNIDAELHAVRAEQRLRRGQPAAGRSRA